MSEDAKSAVPTEEKVKVSRSPSYPSMPLSEALEKSRKLWDKSKRFAVPLQVVASAMEYGVKSSSFAQALSTLRSYGLIDITGVGADRKAMVSDLGQKILLDHKDRDRLIQESALSPTIFRELWEGFYKPGDGMAPDESMIHYLRWDRADGIFNESVILPLIADFKATVGFAKLADGAMMSRQDDKPSDDEKGTGRVRVGDFVQWTSNGMAQFPISRKVVRIDEKDGEKFICVQGDDGEEGWCPMNQVTVESPPNDHARNAGSGDSQTFKPPVIGRRDESISPDMEESRWKIPSGHVVMRHPREMNKRDFKALKKLLDVLAFSALGEDETDDSEKD